MWVEYKVINICNTTIN